MTAGHQQPVEPHPCVGLDDTHPDAHRVMAEGLRAMGRDQRAKRASMLTNRCHRQAMANIERTRPDWPEHEQKLFYVTLTHGRDLAERVRAYMRNRGTMPDAER